MYDLDNYPAQLPNDHIDYFYRNALITRVYDGDTIEITLDYGFGLKFEKISFRLFGINAPEVRGLDKAPGKKTRDWLRQRICTSDSTFDRWGYITSGSPSFIDLQTIKSKKTPTSKGKFGRYLTVLWAKDGRNINREMVDLGLAPAVNY
jgi:micrococcal nuclease